MLKIPNTTKTDRENMSELQAKENQRLHELEDVIREGLQTFIEVGQALSEIRDSRLYRNTYATFEAYCKERWGMTKTSANRLIQASVVAEEMAPFGVKIEKEAHARELALADPYRRVEVYKKAQEIAKRDRRAETPTAKEIKKAREYVTTLTEFIEDPNSAYNNRAPKDPRYEENLKTWELRKEVLRFESSAKTIVRMYERYTMQDEDKEYFIEKLGDAIQILQGLQSLISSSIDIDESLRTMLDEES